ncbi:syntaxin-12-like isoform X3 [Schistocerca americana]|uniref:syntaxin-12-like isoform X3 n=1 Tax=Schistocerca americana TaxID=7009 RepID=UPI001F4F6730|nr:syntaxin-12-like isoform X3 [Schistocerca americana]
MMRADVPAILDVGFRWFPKAHYYQKCKRFFPRWEEPKITGKLKTVCESRLIQYTTDLCKTTSTKLKELAGLCTLGTSVDERKWKLQLKRLSDEFMVICNEFHNTQKIIREKKKNQITSGSDTEGQYSEPRLEHENDVEDEQIRLQEWELKLHFVEEQEQEVQKLQEDILVINQLMREISSLINEQSENVDNIEANVEETTIRVIEGTEQLQQAAIHKNLEFADGQCEEYGFNKMVQLHTQLVIQWLSYRIRFQATIPRYDNFHWPSCLPDLSSCDSFLWGYIKFWVYVTS